MKPLSIRLQLSLTMSLPTVVIIAVLSVAERRRMDYNRCRLVSDRNCVTLE